MCDCWFMLRFGLTHLSSTPVWRRGRSWPHQEGPLPRWDTAPALHSQSSSEGENVGHNIFTPLISAYVTILWIQCQNYIKSLFVSETVYIQFHFLQLLADHDPAKQWKLSVSPSGEVTSTQRGDWCPSNCHVFPSDPGTSTNAMHTTMSAVSKVSLSSSHRSQKIIKG